MTLVLWAAWAFAGSQFTISTPISATVDLPDAWQGLDADDARLPDEVRGGFAIGIVDGAGNLVTWASPSVVRRSCAATRVRMAAGLDGAITDAPTRMGAGWTRWVPTDASLGWELECTDVANGAVVWYVSPTGKPAELEPLGAATRLGVASAPLASGYRESLQVGSLPALDLPDPWRSTGTDRAGRAAWMDWVRGDEYIEVDVWHAPFGCDAAIADRNRRAVAEGWEDFSTERTDSSRLGPAWRSVRIDPNVRVGECASLPDGSSLVHVFSTYRAAAGSSAPAEAVEALIPGFRSTVLDSLPGQTVTVPATGARITLPPRWTGQETGDGLRLTREGASGNTDRTVMIRKVGGCASGRGDLYSSGRGRFGGSPGAWCTDTLGRGALAVAGNVSEAEAGPILDAIAGSLPTRHRPSPPPSIDDTSLLMSAAAGYEHVDNPAAWGGALGVVTAALRGHIIGDDRSPLVLDYKLRTGGAIGGGVLLDGQASLGVSGASLFRGVVAPTAAIGVAADSLGAQKLPLSLSLPVTVGVTTRLGDEVAFYLYGEASWHTAPLRQKGAAWLPFADELELGAQLWLDDRDDSKNGFFLGGRYAQHAHTWVAGGEIGFSFASDD